VGCTRPRGGGHRGSKTEQGKNNKTAVAFHTAGKTKRQRLTGQKPTEKSSKSKARKGIIRGGTKDTFGVGRWGTLDGGAKVSRGAGSKGAKEGASDGLGWNETDHPAPLVPLCSQGNSWAGREPINGQAKTVPKNVTVKTQEKERGERTKEKGKRKKQR